MEKSRGNRGKHGEKKSPKEPAQQFRDQEGVPEKSLSVESLHESLHASLMARGLASVSQWAAASVQ